jgi:hypothetical protein
MERPILFTGPMVRAILEGRKTQTRRVIKPQPADDIKPHKFPNPNVAGWLSSLKHANGSTTAHYCPYGQPGNRLWVRETWEANDVDIERKDKSAIEYRATSFVETLDGWKPSIHMPRWASRILLDVVSVRVERVQDMSFNDWVADFAPSFVEQENARATFVGADNQRKMASEFWDSINAKRGFSWESNPWVWVVEFKQIETCEGKVK